LNRRSGFLTFITAMIPGVGYMYLGLLTRGIETLALFLIIPTLFNLIGLNDITWLFRAVFWFFTFFDTFSIAHKLDRGETVVDNDFIFKSKSENPGLSIDFDKNKWTAIAWVLIIVGIIAIINSIFKTTILYGLIRVYLGRYFLPIILILGGICLLFRPGNKRA